MKKRIKRNLLKIKALQLLTIPGGNWMRKARNFNIKKGVLTAEVKDM